MSPFTVSFRETIPSALRSNPDGGDFKWEEERVQLKLDANEDPFRLFLKTDVFYDHIDRKADMELREGYADYTSGKWDTRLEGRL